MLSKKGSRKTPRKESGDASDGESAGEESGEEEEREGESSESESAATATSSDASSKCGSEDGSGDSKVSVEDYAADFAEFWGCDINLDEISPVAEVAHAVVEGATASSSACGSGDVPAPDGGMLMFDERVNMGDVQMEIPCVGKITYYSATKRFVAVCFAHADQKCTFSSTSKPSDTNDAQGRCVGTLVAWLCQNQPPASASYAVHSGRLNKRSIPHDQRKDGRDLCQLCESGPELLKCERPKASTLEPDEPYGYPVL